MPVAHPGCPMDHFQALANRSPGDLWVRCIGTLSDLSDKVFIVCVVALRIQRTFPGKFYNGGT
jgi:hypothetical protein